MPIATRAEIDELEQLVADSADAVEEAAQVRRQAGEKLKASRGTKTHQWASRQYDQARSALLQAAKTHDAARRKLDAAKRSYQDAALADIDRALNGARPRGSFRGEDVYTPDSESPRFLGDIVAARNGHAAARERLDRHAALMAETRDRQAPGDSFLPPRWMADAWADQPRPAAVVRSAMPEIPWPGRGGLSFIPAWQTGPQVGEQSAPGGTVQDGGATPLVSSAIQAELVTLASNLDVDRQVFERMAPAAEIGLVQSLAHDYDAKLDAQLITGPGTINTHVGLLNSGGGTFDGSAATTAAAQLADIAKAAAQAFGSRHALSTHLILNPKRALFLLTGSTAAGAPLLGQGAAAPAVSNDATNSAGSILGFRLLITDQLDESKMILWRPVDCPFSGTETTFTMEQVLSDSLAIRLQLYGLSQSWMHLQPSSSMTITGLPATGF